MSKNSPSNKLNKSPPNPEEKEAGPRLVAENSGLAALNLGKQFKKRPVLRGISLQVQRGEAVGLLGPNGAGKTTSFYIITGLIAGDYGNVYLDGHDITELPMYRRARLGIGYLPQEASIFRGLTVENNLRAVLEATEPERTNREALLDELLAEFSISHLRRTPALALSGGERRLLEISRALVMKPSVLLVDEPSIGLEPRYIEMVFEILKDLQQNEKKTIILVEQNAKKGLEFADIGYVLVSGETAIAGKGDDLLQNPDVGRLFLGG